jgi:hypothetical protein
MTEPSGRSDAEGITEVKATPEGQGFKFLAPSSLFRMPHIAELLGGRSATKEAGNKSFGVSLFLSRVIVQGFHDPVKDHGSNA